MISKKGYRHWENIGVKETEMEQEITEKDKAYLLCRITDIMKKYPDLIHADSIGDSKKWKIIEEKIEELPEQYQWENIRYQTAYFSERCESFSELSLIIQSGPHDIRLWPLCIEKRNREWRIGSCGGDIIQPLFINGMVSSSKTKRKKYKMMLQLLADLSGLLSIQNLRFCQRMLHGDADVWQRMLMEAGASVEHVTYEAIFDMDIPEEEVKRRLHRTTFQCIAQAHSHYDYEIIDGSCTGEVIDQTMEHFREFHRRVSGRETRGLETWQLQAEGIKNSRNFVVLQYDKHTHSLDGATYFTVTHTYGCYAVAVYNREKFEKAIGHQAQDIAIKRLRELGIRYYVLGDRYYPCDGADGKNIHISDFKEAFATGLFLKLHLVLRREELQQRDYNRKKEREIIYKV